ncbi:MAG: hypothetical protein WD607_05190 [Candidatus Paceibacterota bacterium]
MDKKPITCITCTSKFCEKTKPGTFDICQYGISFLNRKGKIEVKEPRVPLATIARNLRHEINPILQSIIQQVSLIDPNLSTRKIDKSKPLSLVIGSTVIIDNFIQMITGVHEFHSTPSSLSAKKTNLKLLINNYFDIYGIIKESGRAKGLMLSNFLSDNLYITDLSDFIKYIVAVLIDNIWKYSIDHSRVTININRKVSGKYKLVIQNKSNTIPKNIDLFQMGSKVDKNTKGFGYGLFWVKTLENSYNELKNSREVDDFKVMHNQILRPDGYAMQQFIIDNIDVVQQ